MMKRGVAFLILCLCFVKVFAQITWKDDFSSISAGWIKMVPEGEEPKVKDGALVISKEVTALYYLPIDHEQPFTCVVHLNSVQILNFVLGADRWATKDLDIKLDATLSKKRYRIELDLEDHHRKQKELFGETRFLDFDPNEPLIIKLEGSKSDCEISLIQKGNKISLYEGALELGNGESWFGFYGGAVNNRIEVDAMEVTYFPFTPKGVIEFKEGPLEVEKLGSSINTAQDQLAPIISPNGRQMWFASATKMDVIYSAEIRESGFGDVLEAPKNINQSDRNNTLLNVSPDGNTVYISGYFDRGKYVRQGVSKVEKNEKGKWDKPQGLDIPGFVNKDLYSSFFVTSDGNIMLLKMQEKTGTSGGDLYVCFKSGDGSYSKPKHLGDVINSPKAEGTPFLAPDLQTLYFFSEGHPGYGNADIFMSRRLDDSWTNWSQPQNLGPEINSGDWEGYFSLPASGENGYFASYHTGLNRSLDLFKVKLPEELKPKPVILVKGKVLDEKTNLPLRAKISYHDLESDRELGTAMSDPETGYYEIVLPEKKEYSFYALAPDYYSIRENIDLSAMDHYEEAERDLHLAPILKGEAIRLNNVFFVRSKDVLLPKSLPELEKLVEMMKDNPEMKIQIEGHTDNTGSAKLNLELSQARAEKVLAFLAEKGVDKKRMTAKGFGGTKSIAKNNSEETRKLNRRVEFRIL